MEGRREDRMGGKEEGGRERRREYLPFLYTLYILSFSRQLLQASKAALSDEAQECLKAGYKSLQ